MLSKRFCCCFFPLYNSGITLVLVEQVLAGLAIGIVAFAAPAIVAVDIPSFGGYLFGACCIGVALVQAIGFVGVYQDKQRVFRQYTTANLLATVLAFIVGLVWIIVSAVRHSDAKTACVKEFLTTNGSSTSSGETICDIFCWVQLGVLGFLWTFFALLQGYFCAVTRKYRIEQKKDHAKYNSIYSAAGEEIARRSMTWSARNSMDNPRTGGFHGRTDSEMSKSSLRNEVEPEPGSLVYGSYSAVPNQGNYMQEQQYLPPVSQMPYDRPAYSSQEAFSQAYYTPAAAFDDSPSRMSPTKTSPVKSSPLRTSPVKTSPTKSSPLSQPGSGTYLNYQTTYPPANYPQPAGHPPQALSNVFSPESHYSSDPTSPGLQNIPLSSPPAQSDVAHAYYQQPAYRPRAN